MEKILENIRQVRTLVILTVALIGTHSLYRHVASPNWPDAAKSVFLTIAFALVLIGTYKSILFFRHVWKKKWYVPVTLLLAAWIFTINPLQNVEIVVTSLGQSHPEAKGHEVWLKELKADDRPIHLTHWEINTQDPFAWDLLNNSLVCYQPGIRSISWRGLARDGVRITLASHPYSGLAKVTVNGQSEIHDLYQDKGGVRQVEVQLVTPPMGLNILIYFVEDLVLAAILVLGIIGFSQVLHRSVSSTAPDRQQFKRWTFHAAGYTLIAMVAVIFFNAVIDPLQLYRKSRYTPHWSLEQRYQNAGLAKHYPYDTVIMGTSSVENYIPAQVDAILGGHSVKLAMSGSSLHEQAIVLRTALQLHAVKRVVWAVDFMALGGAADRVEEETGPFPKYMYDSNPVNDVAYLLNGTITASSIRTVLHIAKLWPWDTPSQQMLNVWQIDAQFGETYLWKHFNMVTSDDFRGAQRTRRLYDPELYTLEQFRANFEKNIMPLIQEYPETRFDIYFPPYSQLFFDAFQQKYPRVVQDWNALKSEITRKIKPYGNVVITDFQTGRELTSNTQRYKDMLHYDKDMGDQLLKHLYNFDKSYEKIY